MPDHANFSFKHTSTIEWILIAWGFYSLVDFLLIISNLFIVLSIKKDYSLKILPINVYKSLQIQSPEGLRKTKSRWEIVWLLEVGKLIKNATMISSCLLATQTIASLFWCLKNEPNYSIEKSTSLTTNCEKKTNHTTISPTYTILQKQPVIFDK